MHERQSHMAAAKLHRPLIAAAALIACTPLLVQGPSCGHDFDFHLLSWLEAATQLAHGAFPHWAYTPAWNAGEPRFLFYPPLSWLLGALLGLVLPWLLVPAALTFTILTLSGLTMHRLARPYLSESAATLAALFYLANPYMLFTAYERTAYGELLAAACIPLLFAAILAPRLRVLPIAGPVALIWLANAPAGVMSCYALALLGLLRLLSTRQAVPRKRLLEAGRLAAGVLLGLALAGAYLLPAVCEQPLISTQLAVVEGMRIEDSMPFTRMAATLHTSASDAALHNFVLLQASLIALVLFAVLLVAAGVTALRARAIDREAVVRAFPTPTLLCFVIVLALLLMRPALPLWHMLPELRFLQFPWRLLALLAPLCALFAARAAGLQRQRLITSLLLLSLVAILSASAWRLFHQPCDDEDAVPARVALFHSNLGTDQTDEYTPAGADEDALTAGDPPYWLAQRANDHASAGARPGQAPAHLTLSVPTPEYLVLNRRAFALWHLRVDGRLLQADTSDRADGLIDVPLPAGTHHVELIEQRTPIEDAGLGLSVSSGAVALGLYWRTRRKTLSR